MSTNKKDFGFKKTRWHRLLAKLLKEILTPLNISVETDVCVVSDPEADIILIRREGSRWSDKQKVWLTDGLQDTDASHVLLEFKYTESLNYEAFRQTLGYDHFYLCGQRLKRHDLQSFLVSAKTPTTDIMTRLEFHSTSKAGVYASKSEWSGSLQTILLNELSDEPHNAFLKCFASRRTEYRKAFATIKHSGLTRRSLVLERLIAGLRRILMRELVPDPEVEGWTPENVMQLGQEWIDSLIDAMPVEDVLSRYRPEDRLAGLRPEDVLKHYKLEERLAGLGEQEISQAGAQKRGTTLLLLQLEKKFGNLSDGIREKVINADLPTQEKWSLQILEASSLDSVFSV